MKKFKAVKKPIPVEVFQTEKHMDINTLEGTMHANPGDYIVTGPDGEKWPVKKDIFEKNYKIIEDEK